MIVNEVKKFVTDGQRAEKFDLPFHTQAVEGKIFSI